MFNNILVVCIGNICRSPTAEQLLQLRLGEGVTVHSAGLGALVGKDMDATAQAVMRKHGVEPRPHSARQLTEAMLIEADLVLVMEQGHLTAVNRMTPAARGKTMLLGKWNNEQEIADPYRKSEAMFEAVYAAIDNNTKLWSGKLA